MAKKLIVGMLGLAVVVAGIAAFSAFTAQLVNLEAHVEKEIEFAAVANCVNVPATGAITDVVCEATDGNFGTVVPQAEYDKQFEITLSKSFKDNANQTRFGDVHFDLLWECKQIEPAQDTSPADGFDDCRVVENASKHDPSAHATGTLDGRLRDFVSSVDGEPTGRCEIPEGDHTDAANLPTEKDVEFIWHGRLVDGVTDFSGKCFYTVKLLAPPCADSFNPATDPVANPSAIKPIDCHFDDNGGSLDPQEWERFADIGDELKVQVTFLSLRTP